MCIIVYSQDGEGVSRENLDYFASVNRDGIGIAFFDRKKSSVIRSCESVDELCNRFPNILAGSKLPFAIHFRIATSGKINPLNRHPFDILTGSNTKHAIDYQSTKILFHNGIVGDGAVNQSDTSLLADILTDLNANKVDSILTMLSSHSRFLLYWYGKVYTYGYWILDNDTGIYYSHSGYKKPSYVYDYTSWNEYIKSPTTTTKERDMTKAIWSKCGKCGKMSLTEWVYGIGRLCEKCADDYYYDRLSD